MVNIEQTFDTYEAASEWCLRYMRRYHPAGYMTFLHIGERDGKWIVRGKRLASCD
jgi:hypothetical protein